MKEVSVELPIQTIGIIIFSSMSKRLSKIMDTSKPEWTWYRWSEVLNMSSACVHEQTKTMWAEFIRSLPLK